MHQHGRTFESEQEAAWFDDRMLTLAAEQEALGLRGTVGVLPDRPGGAERAFRQALSYRELLASGYADDHIETSRHERGLHASSASSSNQTSMMDQGRHRAGGTATRIRTLVRSS